MTAETITLERIDPVEIVKPKNLLDIWNGNTDMYPLTPLGVFFILQEHLARYKFASKLSNGKTLDIACGTGYGAQILLQENATSYIGADLNNSALKKTQAKLGKSNGCSVVKLDGNFNLPFADKSFETIISFETIEHLQNPVSFLNETRRVLANEGVAIISTPNKKVFSSADRSSNKFHNQEFDFDEFKIMLESTFTYVEYFSQGAIDTSSQTNPSSLKSRVGRTLGMLTGSQTNVLTMDTENTCRYFVAVCHNY